MLEIEFITDKGLNETTIYMVQVNQQSPIDQNLTSFPQVVLYVATTMSTVWDNISYEQAWQLAQWHVPIWTTKVRVTPLTQSLERTTTQKQMEGAELYRSKRKGR